MYFKKHELITNIRTYVITIAEKFSSIFKINSFYVIWEIQTLLIIIIIIAPKMVSLLDFLRLFGN